MGQTDVFRRRALFLELSHWRGPLAGNLPNALSSNEFKLALSLLVNGLCAPSSSRGSSWQLRCWAWAASSRSTAPTNRWKPPESSELRRGELSQFTHRVAHEVVRG